MNIQKQRKTNLLQANPVPNTPNTEDVKNVLKKAYGIYKEIDEIKEEEEDKLIDVVDKIPLNRIIDTEPNNSVSSE